MTIDLEAVRQRLALNQPRSAIEDALLDVAHEAPREGGEALLSVLEEVMVAVRAFRIAVDSGDDGRPLGSALAAADALVARGASLSSWHVQALSAVTRLKYSSTRNQAESALRILTRAGLTPTAPAPKVKPKRVPPLDQIREALVAGQPESKAFLIAGLKPKHVTPDDDLLEMVQSVIVVESAKPSSNSLAAWLRLAKLLLPSPRADRALYEPLVNHKSPTVKTRARACLKSIDAGPPPP